MEEILLRQQFSYARIIPYKNYSKIPMQTVPHSGIHKHLTYQDKYGGSLSTEWFDSEAGIGLSPIDNPKRKNTKFFYWDDDYKNMPIIKYASKHKIDGCTGVFYTTKDRHIKKYYSEPFCDILVVILERSIIRRGNKIIINTNRFTKHRIFNQKYFGQNKQSSSITFDMVKGDFLIVDKRSAGKKKNKGVPRFRKNSFYGLNDFIKSVDGPFKFLKNHLPKTNSIYKELHAAFDEPEFNKTLYTIFKGMIGLSTNNSFIGDIFYFEIMKWFVDTKKIKTPNDYKDLLYGHYPTEKYLKKNDRKLVASVLDVYQIKSKITIKLLHEKPSLDLRSLIILCHLFGDQYQKYIGSIPKDMFGSGSTKNDMIPSSLKVMTSMSNDFKNHGFDITDTEKENLVKVLISEPVRGVTVNENFMGLVRDHFRMLNRIREYDPNIRMRANSMGKFHSEHMELSKIIAQIKKGWVIQYFYPQETIRQIEQPIKTFKPININSSIIGTDMDEHILIYPHVLSREEEYVEEGKFMHHCVATYAETDTSMIISLRTEDNQDRVTCEFNISDGRLLQAKHFSNSKPPKHFDYVIDAISDLTRIHARFGTLNWLSKEKVPVKINGVEIPLEKREPRRLIDILDLDGTPPLPF